jgi:prepilin-type N-terminal cleavage/methylation domain-containing protein
MNKGFKKEIKKSKISGAVFVAKHDSAESPAANLFASFLRNSARKVFSGTRRRFIIFKSFNLQICSGFTLIEVIIYIAIFSMIAVTLVSLAYVSARENQETTNNVINAYENNI